LRSGSSRGLTFSRLLASRFGVELVQGNNIFLRFSFALFGDLLLLEGRIFSKLINFLERLSRLEALLVDLDFTSIELRVSLDSLLLLFFEELVIGFLF
jgi:hypothetical protein